MRPGANQLVTGASLVTAFLWVRRCCQTLAAADRPVIRVTTKEAAHDTHVHRPDQRGRPRPSACRARWPSLALASGLLAACSGDSDGKPELTWYINPDAGGQAAVAEKCSTDEYTDHHPGAPPELERAAHPAVATPRGRGPRDRPDVARPAVHRRVRRRRLPRRCPAGREGAARGAGHLPGCDGRGHLGGQAGGLPVLVQHPGPLVPQVLRREGRHRHVAAGHVGRRSSTPPRRTAARSACRPTSTRATASGSTPSSRALAGSWWRTPTRASTST